MNKKQLYYFVNHPAVNTFYFTSDGQAFTTTPAAAPHAANLQAANKADKTAGVVTTVTRDAIMAWWATEAPKEVIAAADKLAKAQADELTAQKAVNNLTTGNTPSQKMSANLALKTATDNVAKAQAELDEANKAVAALPAATQATPDADPETPLTKDELQKNLDTANSNLEIATKAQTDLLATGTATPTDKTRATNAVKAAKKAVDEATLALDAAE